MLRYPRQRFREFGAQGVRVDVSFAELHDDVARLAAELHWANIGRRTRVGILGPHSGAPRAVDRPRQHK
jgi:hypothetical protein